MLISDLQDITLIPEENKKLKAYEKPSHFMKANVPAHLRHSAKNI